QPLFPPTLPSSPTRQRPQPPKRKTYSEADETPLADTSERVGPSVPITPPLPSVEDEIEIDSFRTDYHPATGKAPNIKAFEDYDDSLPPRPPRDGPYLPFRSESEFDISELIISAHLSSGQANTLLKVINKLRNDPKEVFLLTNHDDVKSLLDVAAQRHAPFQKTEVVIKYKDKDLSYPLMYRPLKDWAKHLLADPYLGSVAKFDAERLHKWNGEKWERIYTGPHTTRRMWKIQDAIPASGRPLLITIYIDKTKLSSFNNVTGYPVMARIENFPEEISNGKGFGSTELVGWLPVVEDIPAEKNKTDWANHKREVYHECLRIMFASVANDSIRGDYYNVASLIRLLYPLIYVASTDYEEQAMITLIRGVMSLKPCPKCLVSKDDLWDIGHISKLRTSQDSQKCLDKANKAKTKKDKEEILKAQGLRPVENAFWDLNFSDPHDVVTFDELHNNCHGVGGKHSIEELVRLVDAKPDSRDVHTAIGQSMVSMPSWPHLKTFHEGFLLDKYADGNHFRDILKLLIFSSQHVFGKDVTSPEFKFLCLLRAYLNMVMCETLHVHTDETIARGRGYVEAFGRVIHEYNEVLAGTVDGYRDTPPDGENIDADDEEAVEDEGEFDAQARKRIKPTQHAAQKYNYPKTHAQQHAYDDIEDKGPIIRYSTRNFEGRHRPIKELFQTTNFKNIDEQILTGTMREMITHKIREEIDSTRAALTLEMTEPMHRNQFGNVYLGAAEDIDSLAGFELTYNNDPAFKDLHGKTIRRLSDLLSRPSCPVVLKNGLAPVKAYLNDDPQIVIPYKLLKVTYESQVDWRAATDILRINPSFHHKARYDNVMIVSDEDQNKIIFAQLLFVFTVTLPAELFESPPDGEDVAVPLALVLPYKEVHNKGSKERDDALRLIRLRRMDRSEPRVVPARSIKRGAYIVPEGGLATSLVVDVVDHDMFLRLQNYYPL
ncbi:hypothetical protein H0H93_005922, partial [Arthromyces matolae]